MPEVKREPIISFDVNGDETVTFDVDHTLRDIIRYLLTQTDKDELIYLIEAVEKT